MIQRDNFDYSDDWSCGSLKNQQSICKLKSESSPQKQEAPIFTLNQQQRIMIQHKLPKGYCLLPLPSHFSKLKRKQTMLLEESLKFVNDANKKRGRPQGSLSRNQSKTSLESERKSSRLACVKKIKYNKRNWQVQSLQSSYISQSNPNFEQTEHVQIEKQQERERIMQEKSSDISQNSLNQKYYKEQPKQAQHNEAPKLSDKLQPINVPQPAEKDQIIQKQERKVISGPLFRVQISIKIPMSIDKNKENQELNKKTTSNEIKISQKQDQKIQQSSKFVDKFNQQLLILTKLKNHKYILPFLQPVNQQRDGAPDYYNTIASPIDLQTIEFKLQSHIYKQPAQFHHDVQRMWSNSFIYNKNNQFMLQTTEKLKIYYENLIGKKQRLKSKKQKMQNI